MMLELSIHSKSKSRSSLKLGELGLDSGQHNSEQYLKNLNIPHDFIYFRLLLLLCGSAMEGFTVQPVIKLSKPDSDNYQ